MQLIIVIFGLAILAAGLLMLWKPSAMLDFLRRHAGSTLLHQLAIGVRLLLGIVLIQYAESSRFPLLLSILGGFSIAAAIVIAILPESRFEQLINWITRRFEGYVRPASAVVMVFGLFLIVAVF